MEMALLREQKEREISSGQLRTQGEQSCNLTLPATPYSEQPPPETSQLPSDLVDSSSWKTVPPDDLIVGLVPLRNHPALMMGVASDPLFPAWQQKEIAETLRVFGNRSVTHDEFGEDISLFGHDNFLFDLKHIGRNIRTFLN